MKKSIYLLPFALFIALMGCDKSPFKKDFERSGIEGDWYLVKTEVNGNVQSPGEAEKNDKLVLNADKTFVLVERGEVKEGEWEAFPRIGSINLMETGSYNCLYYFVEENTSDELVLEKDQALFHGNTYRIYYSSTPANAPAPATATGNNQ